MCFLLGANMRKETERLESRALGTIVHYDDYLNQLTEWVLKFWLNPDDIDWEYQDLIDLMYYFIHTLSLTRSLIDVKFKKTSLVSKVSFAIVGIFTKPGKNAQ